ncbi:TPA: DUF4065 domain-containing protein [Clostridioides difficile]|uniref:Panacea domain-containing protein n=1 Tax=Clostridioides difficile TaxID=1496 RepID=UPI00038C6F42|nr:type II toxin-antitoxin system antitoxin SocA domain-containing protein [Clostridioides difficile]EQI78445.1 hypothetical protein QQI_2955 [Clostridioides difficile Y401]HCP7139068.1 DUF4065 domain-containing protein [Clostridioides difficile]
MFYAKYDAMDVAEYILWYCENELKRPISNLQLQKILYYVQGEYLATHDEPLFDNKIEAWAYGPVVPDVYYSFNKFRSREIKGVIPERRLLFEDDELELIQGVVCERSSIDVWDLVSQTHETSPWQDNYIEGRNMEISNWDIKDYFNNN